MTTSIYDAGELSRSVLLGVSDTARAPESGTGTLGSYAREQLRGLVRQVFLADAARRVRQVILTAADPQTDIATICRHVGENLAAETRASVVVVSSDPGMIEEPTAEGPRDKLSDAHLHGAARRVRANLWLAPDAGFAAPGFMGSELYSPRLRYARLTDLRREFEYSIVQSQAASESSDVLAMGQIADGVVLVLEAHRTRRAAALNISRMLQAAGVRLLGTVLSGRTFPIPEAIYKRL